MAARRLSALLLALGLAARAAAARVELVPETALPTSPAAAPAVTASAQLLTAPLSSALLASPAGLLAAPPSLPAAAALASPAALAAPAAPSVTAAAPVSLTALTAPAPVPAAAAPAVAETPAGAGAGKGPHAGLLQSLSAPLPEFTGTSAAGAAAAADGDFSARAGLGATASASGAVVVPAPSPATGLARWGRESRRYEAQAKRAMAETVIPAWVGAELPVTAARLRRPSSAEYERGVRERTKVWVYSWHSRLTYEIQDGLPDGHYDPKFGIRLMLRTNWRALKDPETHFRVLFAHEYTHWLQHEGRVTNRYGVEIPPVAVELLRGIELVGLEGLRQGRVEFIHEGVLGRFEEGRRWVHGDMQDITTLYWRGGLGGAAYEVGVIAGRPEAAWEFLNLVIAEKGGLSPREAFTRVTGLPK